MGANDIRQSAMPVAISHKWDPPDFIDIECGIPVDASDIKTQGHVKLSSLPAGNALKVEHWGDYNKLESTYEALYEWMEQNDLAANGPSWEVYVTDPGDEPDVDKWLTEIYVPVE